MYNRIKSIAVSGFKFADRQCLPTRQRANMPPLTEKTQQQKSAHWATCIVSCRAWPCRMGASLDLPSMGLALHFTSARLQEKNISSNHIIQKMLMMQFEAPVCVRVCVCVFFKVSRFA